MEVGRKKTELRRPHRELLWEIETLRTKLAVAMAAGRKQSTPALWMRYFEIESEIRTLLRGLRVEREKAPPSPVRALALQILRQVPEPQNLARADRGAESLCNRLADVVRLLEAEKRRPPLAGS